MFALILQSTFLWAALWRFVKLSIIHGIVNFMTRHTEEHPYHTYPV